MDVSDFHFIFKTLRTGVESCASVEAITLQLGEYLLGKLLHRGIAFSELSSHNSKLIGSELSNVQDYSKEFRQQLYVATFNNYMAQIYPQVLTLKNFVIMFTRDHKLRTANKLSRKSGVPGLTTPLIDALVTGRRS